ncbi:MAG: GGDEF domain-containing response regulator [Bdellovibrionia bacterium]
MVLRKSKSPRISFDEVLLLGESLERLGPYAEIIRSIPQCQVDLTHQEGRVFQALQQGRDPLMIVMGSGDSPWALVLLEKIRKISPLAAIVLLQARPTIEQAVLAMKLGARDYLVQSMSPLEFKKSVCEILNQKKGLSSLAFLDETTGLYNARYLSCFLDRKISEAKLSGQSFSVLFLDVDGFKQLNESVGHLLGSEILNELGEHLKKQVRHGDVLFRYGGDEFVAVLNSCPSETAQAVAERMRKSVERKTFLRKQNLKVHFTVSIGVALFPHHASTKKEMLQMADEAMFRAKKISRNTIQMGHSPALRLKSEVFGG